MYLDLHFGHVGCEAQRSILPILLWIPAVVGKQHCLVIPKRLVAISFTIQVSKFLGNKVQRNTRRKTGPFL